MAIGTLQRTSITDLLREDHRRMKRLFAEVERGDTKGREQAAREALQLFQAHDRIEKRVLYPSAKELSREVRDLVLRCLEGHHVINVLLLELKVIPFGARYWAKFSKAQEAILNHIQEEESDLFPVMERSGVDLGVLGEQMIDLKERVLSRRFAMTNGRSVTTIAGVAALAGIGWWAYNLLSKRD